MLFTSKQYNAVADRLSTLDNVGAGVVEALADLFGEDNRRFDRGRFFHRVSGTLKEPRYQVRTRGMTPSHRPTAYLEDAGVAARKWIPYLEHALDGTVLIVYTSTKERAGTIRRQWDEASE